MMRRTLRYKINGAILVTFIVISLIFCAIQLMLQNRRTLSTAKEIETLLQMVVEREKEDIANELYQGLSRALTLRLDLIREKGNIFLISVFDSSGKLLVSRGLQPETTSLSETDMGALENGLRVIRTNCHGIFSMVYLQRIEIIGEPIGYLRICYSLEKMMREQRENMVILGALLLSILAIMLILLNLIMSRTIVKPILSLSDSMNRMQAGKFKAHVCRSKDEIGLLSSAFNRMASDLAASYQDLELKGLQLQNARQSLSNFINSMPSIMLGVDETLNVTQWNLKAQRITGIEPVSAIGKPLGDVLPQLEGAMEMVRQALHEYDTRKMENVLWDNKGTPAYVDITVNPLITGSEKGAVVRVADVTARRLTQEALRESQEKYRLVVENANDSILVIQEGFIIFANKKAESLSGFSAKELCSKPFTTFVSDGDKASNLKNYTNRMEGKSAPSNYSFQIKHKSGKTIWVNCSTVLISWDNRPATLNFIRDISTLKRTEEQLLHAQKMEAIGILAGGIAHDFNNLLQVIQGYAQLLLFNKKDDVFRRELEAILSAARKGGELTMQLLTFGRKVENHPKSVDINVQIEKAEKMLSRTIPKMIRIELNLLKDIPAVYVDPGQMEQVVMNLVINAKDAMPEGGRIQIETDTVFLNGDDAKAEMVPYPGEYVRLRISDSGQGISEETLGHIFEPFFTTKKLGDGTGLGLAIVYGIVQNHNGSILCHSVRGEGTTFTVYFPAVKSKAKPAEESKSAPPVPVGGTESILLVDDEETLRDIGCQILERFGYSVLTASSAEEALEIYSGQPDPADISLVILDLVMPGMGGAKGIEAFLDINPEIKIIVASGYMLNTGRDALIADLSNTKGFIKKPFVLENMLREIRRVIDGKDDPDGASSAR